MKIKLKNIFLIMVVSGLFFSLILPGNLFGISLKVVLSSSEINLGNYTPGVKQYWVGHTTITVDNTGSDLGYVIKIKNNNPDNPDPKALYLESNPAAYFEWKDDNPCFICLARIYDAPNHAIFSRDINLKPGIENAAYEGRPREYVILDLFYNVFVPFKLKGADWDAAFGRYKADLIISVI